MEQKSNSLKWIKIKYVKDDLDIEKLKQYDYKTFLESEEFYKIMSFNRGSMKTDTETSEPAPQKTCKCVKYLIPQMIQTKSQTSDDPDKNEDENKENKKDTGNDK